MTPAVTQVVTRVIGDDWTFFFSCAAADGTPYDLSGYTPGGVLSTPSGSISVYGSMVDTTTLTLGTFALTVPRATTSAFSVDKSYSLRVYLIDAAGLQRTYVVVPISVFTL